MFCISFITFAVLIFKRQSSGSSKYTVTEQFNVTSEYLWQIITDYEMQPLWRSGLVKVEKIVNNKGRDIWKETDVNGQQIEWESFALAFLCLSSMLRKDPPRRGKEFLLLSLVICVFRR